MRTIQSNKGVNYGKAIQTFEWQIIGSKGPDWCPKTLHHFTSGAKTKRVLNFCMELCVNMLCGWLFKLLKRKKLTIVSNQSPPTAMAQSKSMLNFFNVPFGVFGHFRGVSWFFWHRYIIGKRLEHGRNITKILDKRVFEETWVYAEISIQGRYERKAAAILRSSWTSIDQQKMAVSWLV